MNLYISNLKNTQMCWKQSKMVILHTPQIARDLDKCLAFITANPQGFDQKSTLTFRNDLTVSEWRSRKY